MADATYTPLVYREQGGSRFVVASGGSADVESGGEIDIESGGSLKIAGTALTVTAAELNLADNQVASVTWTLASTSSYTKSIVAQLKDAAGAVMAGNQVVKLYLFADAGPAAFLTPTSAQTMSTGGNAATCDLVVGSSSAPQYSMYAITSTSGLLSLTWSDTGETATYIGMVLPGGRFALSTAAITTTSS